MLAVYSSLPYCVWRSSHRTCGYTLLFRVIAYTLEFNRVYCGMSSHILWNVIAFTLECHRIYSGVSSRSLECHRVHSGMSLRILWTVIAYTLECHCVFLCYWTKLYQTIYRQSLTLCSSQTLLWEAQNSNCCCPVISSVLFSQHFAIPSFFHPCFIISPLYPPRYYCSNTSLLIWPT